MSGTPLPEGLAAVEAMLYHAQMMLCSDSHAYQTEWEEYDAALTALREHAERVADLIALVAEDHDNPACRQEGCRYAAALSPFAPPPETEETHDARQ